MDKNQEIIRKLNVEPETSIEAIRNSLKNKAARTIEAINKAKENMHPKQEDIDTIYNKPYQKLYAQYQAILDDYNGYQEDLAQIEKNASIPSLQITKQTP